MKRLNSTENVVKILFLLRDENKAMGLTEITKKTTISKSTVYNILNTLIHYNLIKKDEDSKKYSLGISILSLSSVVIDSLDIRNISKPYMQLLAKKTKSTVTLGIRNDDKFTFIERIDGVRNVRFFCDIGKDVKLFKGAASKAYFANLPYEKQLKVYGVDELDKYIDEIQEIRKIGYSTSNEEVDKGVIAFGAPIFDYKNEVVSALAIANIVGVLSEDKLKSNIEELIDTAKQISKDLGSDNDL
ncbi:IclR family transcriptional regulator [Peptoniphilus rhinitidis]|uniref:IclR family transcriptional regulator n=1 Tax=Peptoniphilus rhinitidis TaxID=1175452 RepID=UPI0029020B4E|nr:IclR family transcriptional regulator [Peptoniphilus rhinitidis]MDU1043212.1 IclR family transcriptional regulator [Peptoniphilus rhinitidis]